MSNGDHDQSRALEARVEALSATLKGVLTHLVLRGLLTKAEVTALLQETEVMLHEHHPEAVQELRHVLLDGMQFLRVAVGPGPDPDHDDH